MNTNGATAINFDGPNSGPVREFFVTNGRYWIEEFHFDGFRFDATHAIRDQSKEYIIGAVGRAARKAAGTRSIILIAENDLQEARMARPQNEGGDDLDGMWNDDFHHNAVVALTGARNVGYLTITAANRRNSFPLRNMVFFIRVRHFRGEKHCVALRPSAFPRRRSFVASKTTIKSRIPDPGERARFQTSPATLSRNHCASSARTVDTIAVSGTGVRRVQSLSVFCRHRRCIRSRCNSQRSRTMAGAIFIAYRGGNIKNFTCAR